MAIRQISDRLMLLEDTVTYPTALLSGVLLAMFAILVFLSFPLFYRPPISLWFSALFMAGDVFLILSARKIKISLDKESRTITVEKFSIIGKKSYSIPMDSVESVSLKQEGSLRMMHIPVLIMKMRDGRILSYDHMVDEAFDASVVASFIGVRLVPYI